MQDSLPGDQHPDDIAVQRFAEAMKYKMKVSRNKGRTDWRNIPPHLLLEMLKEHVEKGDMRDVANFCMMIWHNSAPTPELFRE